MQPKVLFVSHESGLDGGAARSLVDFLSLQNRQGFDAVVAVPQAGMLSQECDRMDVPWVQYRTAWWITPGSEEHWLYSMGRLPQAVSDLGEVIAREGIRLVHSNSAVNPAGAFAAAIAGIPHIWHIRERVFDPNFGMRTASFAFETHREVVHQLSSALVVVSTILGNSYKATNGAPMQLIYNGADLQRFGNPCFSAQPSVLAIGTVTPEKGLEDLLEAASILKDDGLQFKVVVLGEFQTANVRKDTVAFIRRNGLEQVFQFPGFVSDVTDFLANARVLCQPSRSEGMSRVVLEAMAAGVPVVCADSGGPAELIDGGNCGLLVPIKEPATLAEALHRVLIDDDLAQSLSTRARSRVERKFDLSKTSCQLRDLLIQHIEIGQPARCAALSGLFLDYIRRASPRVLIGKKWALMKRFM